MVSQMDPKCFNVHLETSDWTRTCDRKYTVMSYKALITVLIKSIKTQTEASKHKRRGRVPLDGCYSNNIKQHPVRCQWCVFRLQITSVQWVEKLNKKSSSKLMGRLFVSS